MAGGCDPRKVGSHRLLSALEKSGGGGMQAARIREEEDKRLPMGLRQWGAMLGVTRSQSPGMGEGGFGLGGQGLERRLG